MFRRVCDRITKRKIPTSVKILLCPPLKKGKNRFSPFVKGGVREGLYSLDSHFHGNDKTKVPQVWDDFDGVSYNYPMSSCKDLPL